MTLVPASVRHDGVAALLALAMYPDPERVRRTLDRYATEAALSVWIWQVGGEPVAAAGLRIGGRKAELLHLGTRPDQQGRGFARRLLHALMAHLDLSEMQAETDDGAVEFYRRSGFRVVTAGERGGHDRYRGTLTGYTPFPFASASR